MPTLKTAGFHHVTLMSRDAPKTVAFYRDLLGFNLVKQTVNFDLPSTRHLYFGDAAGSPGSIVTVFEWPSAPRGMWGVGAIHHVAFGVGDADGQLQWKRRLIDAGVPVSGPYERGYFKSIYFQDPDGQILEIATQGPGFAIDEPAGALGRLVMQPKPGQLPAERDEDAIRAMIHPEPVSVITPEIQLRGIHHVTGITDDMDASDRFYQETLGLSLIKKTINQDDPDTFHYFWANYDGAVIAGHSDMTLFGWKPGARKGREGVGQTHHIAFRAASEEQQLEWRDHLLSLGLDPSPVRDRTYFKSIYFRSPDGLLVEIATDGPGFAIDEDAGQLGRELKVPAFLDRDNAAVAASLKAV